MTVYNAGSINGAESVAEVYGVEIESIKEINKVKIEHVPLDTVIFYHGTISDPTGRTADLSSYGLPGWYVCNGESSTPELITPASFLYGYSSIGSSGGNDVRSLINHSHTTPSDGGHNSGHSCSTGGSHNHEVDQFMRADTGGFGQQAGQFMGPATVLTDTSTHNHTCTSSGSHSNHSISHSGSGSPNNRPLYRTLIPIIRLVRLQFEFVVGCVMWYDANDISNPSGRTGDLEAYGLPGWYVCNNQSGSLDMQDRFVRCEGTSNTGGGTDTAVNAYHNHSDSSIGSHNHSIYNNNHDHYVPPTGTVWKYSGTYTINWPSGLFNHHVYTTDTYPNHSHSLASYTNTHDHSGTSYNSGAGDADNRPLFYSMLLIERLS